jgi:hypothetical protein
MRAVDAREAIRELYAEWRDEDGTWTPPRQRDFDRMWTTGAAKAEAWWEALDEGLRAAETHGEEYATLMRGAFLSSFLDES